jgi:hypothetical protein
MTEIAITERRRRLSTQRLTLRLVIASLMASAAIAGGLAIQMGKGHDPALGAGTSSAQAQAASSASNDPSDGFGQAQDGSSDFDQAASPPASVTTRSS